MRLLNPGCRLLTFHEREILGLIAAGKTNPQIAAQLVIGAGSVKTHTLTIYRKLEVANRTHAIVRAGTRAVARLTYAWRTPALSDCTRLHGGPQRSARAPLRIGAWRPPSQIYQRIFHLGDRSSKDKLLS